MCRFPIAAQAAAILFLGGQVQAADPAPVQYRIKVAVYKSNLNDKGKHCTTKLLDEPGCITMEGQSVNLKKGREVKQRDFPPEASMRFVGVKMSITLKAETNGKVRIDARMNYTDAVELNESTNEVSQIRGGSWQVAAIQPIGKLLRVPFGNANQGPGSWVEMTVEEVRTPSRP